MKEYIKSLQIGNVNLKNNLISAPMAGVSDLVFRTLCRRYDVGLAVTEMISAKALEYNNKKCYELLETNEFDRPLAVQIFGHEVQSIIRAVEILNTLPFDILDFNMGCPVPKIFNNKDGCALMKEPLEVERIVKAVVKYSKKPVTVKIRAGIDENSVNAVLIAKIIEESGACAVAVHGRTRSQMYEGFADLNVIAEVKRHVKIPVIANGDIVDNASAKRMFDITCCDGIMIARGSRGRPFIFKEILTDLRDNRPYSVPDKEELIELILEHTRMMIDKYGENAAIKKMRKHIAWYTASFPNSARIRQMTNCVTGYDELKEILIKKF